MSSAPKGPRRARLLAAPIQFLLRKSETLTVVVVDSHSRIVRTLLDSGPRPAGRQRFTWDGRDEAGHVVPAGTYRPRLHLARGHRTILMPNPIKVDPIAPRIALASVTSRAFSPDRDNRNDLVRLRYRTSESARALLFVNGRLRVKLHRYSRTGVLRWFGSGMPAGHYQLVLRAVDLAGNLSAPVSGGVVRIRFVSVRPHVLHPAPHARIGFRVRTDAKRFHWRLGHSGGRAAPGLLVLRAPGPGRYALVVTANGHTARSVVIVEPRP